MFISENDAFRILDKISQFSSQRDFLLSIISTLHTTDECDFLINLIDKGMIISKTQVSGLTLLIKDERKKAKPKEDYLKRVYRMYNKIKPWKRFSEIIKTYCESHGLSYEKLMTMAKEYNNEFMLFCYLDPSLFDAEKYHSIDDSELPPLVLAIDFKDPKNLIFKQTEHTRKYIGNEMWGDNNGEKTNRS